MNMGRSTRHGCNMAPVQYEWDPDFDPFTQGFAVRGSNLRVRVDRETGALIWRKAEGDHHGSAADSIGHPAKLQALADLAAYEAEIAAQEAARKRSNAVRLAFEAARAAGVQNPPIEEVLPPPPPWRPRRNDMRTSAPN
jgi:hypothetical protein